MVVQMFSKLNENSIPRGWMPGSRRRWRLRAVRCAVEVISTGDCLSPRQRNCDSQPADEEVRALLRMRTAVHCC